jgi:hypothetical protein
MNPVTDPPASKWLNGRQASKTIGCSPSALQRAVMLGHVRVQLEPGVAPRYCREDVERLARTRLQPVGA